MRSTTGWRRSGLMVVATVVALAAGSAEARSDGDVPAWFLGSGGDGGASGSIRVDAPPEAVWSVLHDLESWPLFFRDLESVALRRADDGELILEQHHRALGATFRTKARVALDPERHILRLTHAPAEDQDVDDLRTMWRIRPDADSGTRVELFSHVSPRRSVPAFIERRAVARSVRRALDGLAAEVVRRRSIAAR